RQHSGRRSRERQVRDALRRVRWTEAVRPERSRLRRCRRLLVHRPGQDARARRRPRRRLLREGRRLADPGSDLPARAAERHRAVARREDALRRREAAARPAAPLSQPHAGIAGTAGVAGTSVTLRLGIAAAVLFVLTSLAMANDITPSVRSELAPTGKLRVGINYGNFLLVTSYAL